MNALLRYSLLSLAVLLATAGVSCATEPLRVITWNVESGGAKPATIARQLAELPQADAYLLQEVSPQDIGRYAAAIRDAHGKSFKHYLSTLGGSDRVAICVDEERFEIEAFTELFRFGEYRLNDWRHRSPLVAQVTRKSDGRRLHLVTVHLARGNAELRTEQAAGLREWAKVQRRPIVLAGDCNFDFAFRSRKGNAAYDAFFAEGVWQEATPEELIDTNWSDGDGDGRDNYPDSSLDFVAFYSQGSSLTGSCRVLVRSGDFPDTEATSDHRPVLGVLRFAESEPTLPAGRPERRVAD